LTYAYCIDVCSLIMIMVLTHDHLPDLPLLLVHVPAAWTSFRTGPLTLAVQLIFFHRGGPT